MLYSGVNLVSSHALDIIGFPNCEKLYDRYATSFACYDVLINHVHLYVKSVYMIMIMIKHSFLHRSTKQPLKL